MPRRIPLLFASMLIALLVTGSAHAGTPKAKPSASSPASAPTVAKTKSLAQMTKVELKKKMAATKLPNMSVLFEPLEGDELPEMHAHKASDFDLVYRGVKATAFEDGDGADEVAVWIATVRPTANGYTKSVHKLATPQTLSSLNPGSIDGATTLFHGDRTPMLLLGAVIEDDDGSAAQWIAELDVLLDQAIAAATVMREPDDDPLAVLHGTLELGKIMLGADPGRPDLDIRPIRATDWDMLWDVDPTREGGRPDFAAGATATKTKTVVKKASAPLFVYKIAMNGKIGTGRYALRLDVPAAAGRKPRRVVKVDLDKMKLVTPGDEIDATTNHEFVVRVCVAQAGWVGMNWSAASTPTSCIDKVMSAPYGDYWPEFKVYRRMQQGSTKVNVFAWWRSESNNSSGFKFLDFDDGKLGFVKIDANVGGTAGAIESHVQGDGEGGGLYNSECYSCGFPSGNAIGKLDMRVRW